MLVPKLRFKREDGTDYPEWEQTSLEDVCDIVGGGTPSTKNIDYWNGNIQWFTPSEIGKTKYVSKSVRTISQVGFEKSSARKLPVGTILLTSRATLGEMAIATIECTTNHGFQSLIPHLNPRKEPEYSDHEFVFSSFNCFVNQLHFRRL